MNTSASPETRALATAADGPYEVALPTDAASMILGPAFDRVQTFASLMAKGAVSVPKHLRGNMGDCMAITIQALGWRMNPFAVAQKTHLSQSGALGYEAQLVSAVLVSSGAIVAEPDYTPVGDWSQILGKVEERQGKQREDGSPGGKYYVATYTAKDEEGLGVIVRAQLRCESKPRELKVMMRQAFPRFSTQWATDPYQQLCYLAVRKWGRLHSPGSILGVYTPEELEDRPARDMGMADVVTETTNTAATDEAPATYSSADFEKNRETWRKVIAAGKATPEAVIAKVNSLSPDAPLSDAQKTAIRAMTPQAQAAQADRAIPPLSHDEILAKLEKAPTQDELDTVMSLATDNAALSDDERKALNNAYDARLAAFKA